MKRTLGENSMKPVNTNKPKQTISYVAFGVLAPKSRPPFLRFTLADWAHIDAQKSVFIKYNFLFFFFEQRPWGIWCKYSARSKSSLQLGGNVNNASGFIVGTFGLACTIVSRTNLHVRVFGTSSQRAKSSEIEWNNYRSLKLWPLEDSKE